MIKYLLTCILIAAPLSFASAYTQINASTNSNCTQAQAHVSPNMINQMKRHTYQIKNLLQHSIHSPIKGEFDDATFANAYINSTPTMNSAEASAGWLYTFTMKINACPGQSANSKSFMADSPNSIQHDTTIKSTTTKMAFHCTLATAMNLNGTNTNTITTWSGAQTGRAATQHNTSNQSCSTTLSCQIVETVTNTCQQSQ